MKNKIYLIITIILLTVIFIIFYKGLNNSNIYKPINNDKRIVPKFSANSFFENKLINSNNIFNQKKFYLLNIWASWCVPCKYEHPYLMKLKENEKIEIIGLNYKDNYTNAKKFIDNLGNPYSIILLDKKGTKAIEWGAYGVPETFLIFENEILKKYIGPLNSELFIEIENLIK